jgi:hypothetical protein
MYVNGVLGGLFIGGYEEWLHPKIAIICGV